MDAVTTDAAVIMAGAATMDKDMDAGLIAAIVEDSTVVAGSTAGAGSMVVAGFMEAEVASTVEAVSTAVVAVTAVAVTADTDKQKST
jgi:hypothetical protein